MARAQVLSSSADAGAGVEGDVQATSEMPAAVAPASRKVLLKLLLVLADTAAVVIGLIASLVLQQLVHPVPSFLVQRELLLGLATLPVWVAALASRRLYLARYVVRPTEELRRVLEAALLAAVGLVTVAFVAHVEGLSRLWVGLTLVSAAVALTIERTVARILFRRARERRSLTRRIILVGQGPEALDVCQGLRAEKRLGYVVVGVTSSDRLLADLARVPYLGDWEDTLGAAERLEVDGVVIAASGIDTKASNRLVRSLTDAGIHVELSVTLRDVATNRIRVQPLGRFPVAYIEPVIRTGWRPLAKRAFDIAFSVFVLLVASPVLLMAALAIKLDSPGPVFFRQRRVGRNGHTFGVLKLRTMVVDAEAQRAALEARNESDGPLFKIREDPRVTRVGRILRKLSIDEIPQFFNVVRNDMSVVGPRPALESEMAAWSDDLHGRLRVKPGITGMWQVHGRSNTSFSEYERLDLYYVDNWSLLNDVAIVLRTVPAVLLRRGAC